MAEAKVGIIGGTGLYDMEGMTDIKEVIVKTPFGEPSDAITVGNLEGVSLAFLARHGKGHRISPTEVPARANIYALKTLGVERIIAVNAVGSLKESIRILDLVIPDQLIDRTRNRPSTFFGRGLVVHVAFAQPFCSVLSQVLFSTAHETGVRSHKGGTYVAMEGPQFSTRAESELYRLWGSDVIGMTVLPEAKLAREAEICYSSLSFVTDYDCWHDAYESVTPEMILSNLHHNIDTAKQILKTAIAHLPQERDCICATALKNAIITAPENVPVQVKRDLAPLIGKYLP